MLILGEKCPVYRSIKGDGNCFYRAFGFAFFENILYNS